MKKLIFPLLLMLAIGMLAAVESDPSNVVGYVKYPCVAGVNTVALPMEQGFEWATEVGDHIGATMVGTWNPALEGWDAIEAFPWGGWDGDDFPVAPGAPLLVYVEDAMDFYSIGGLPEPATFALVEGNNVIMLPLNKSELAIATDLGDDIGATMIGSWNPVDEGWDTIEAFPWGGWDGDDFTTAIGDPLLVYVEGEFTWPAAAARGTFNVTSK